jgi:hypothetical protein
LLGGARLAPFGGEELCAAFLAPLLDAFLAFAAVWLDEPAHIVAAVIVGDLLARLDVLEGANEDLALAPVGLAIRAAGMIGVAPDIPAAGTIDGPAAVELVQIFRVLRFHRLGLLVVEQTAGILDDERSLDDRFGGEQPQPGS